MITNYQTTSDNIELYIESCIFNGGKQEGFISKIILDEVEKEMNKKIEKTKVKKKYIFFFFK